MECKLLKIKNKILISNPQNRVEKANKIITNGVKNSNSNFKKNFKKEQIKNFNAIYNSTKK